MSAYVCSDADFATLAAFAMANNCAGTNRKGEPRRITRVANILGAENVRSVNYRYAHNADAQETFTLFTGKQIREHAHEVSPVQIVKLCDCLKYQSCETDDYEQTEAYALLMTIRAKACEIAGYPAEFSAYCDRPEYNAAQWGMHT